MLFNSLEYLFIFIPILFVIYFLLNKFKCYTLSKLFLLLASLYFYASYKFDYVIIILVSVLFNYAISIVFKNNLNNKFNKIILILSIFANISMLLYFKYFNSVVELLRSFSFDNFNTMEIILPLGISFFTLQQISYLVDCYKGKINDHNLLDYSLYICFFPQLIAGPIVRYQEMIPQFRNLKNKYINQENIFLGLFLITIGLLKKTVFADEFASYINYVTQNQIYNDFFMSWLLAISKTLQIYFDFSGYCDIALGSSALFNIKLPWNFNSPYQAVSIEDFWKRNNMTLIRFINDYVYKPLGADKGSLFKTTINIFIMFLLVGLWMGINFISILYGILLSVYYCINIFWKKLNIHIPKFIGIAITFISIVFTAPFLFEKNINNLITIIKSMLGINATFTSFFIQGSNLQFLLTPPHNAQINLFWLFLGLIIVLFFKNSNQISISYSKSNSIFYTFLLSIAFLYSVLCITRSTSFIYFVF